MTIGIDISPACRKQKTGIEWYAWHVTREILNKHGREHAFRLYTDKRAEPLFSSAAKYLSWHSKYFWPELRLSLEIAVNAPDVLFVPSRALPLVLPKKTITTIHDVGFISFPDERKKVSREYLLMTSCRAAQKAHHILTVSEFSKQEIIRNFSIAPEKITVTYLGYDTERYVPTKESLNGKPYIVCIGRRERRKNLSGLIRGYELLTAKMGSDAPDLVLIGPAGHYAHEIDSCISDSTAREHIRIHNWLSEEAKIKLLQHAILLVQPSLYEGFGLPLIEAQGCHIPVASSRSGSLPEIAGDSALFFDPLDPVSMSEVVYTCIHDASARQRLIAKGQENCRRFSWKQCAEDTFRILVK
ncbi:glycosyltransferase family 4 protein [Candidatus Uhrbacteria bacterium]|nr:glycosyltransferase family 4 protein [Candidatus Uhrbacteria bacterium]